MASFANTPVYLDSLPQGSNPSIISKISTPFAFPIVKIDMYNRNIFFVYLNNKDCYRLQSSNKYLYFRLWITIKKHQISFLAYLL